MRKLLYLVLASTCLSGCVTTAVVAGASSVASTVIYDKRGLKKIRQDAMIERNFYNILDQQDDLESSNIEVKSVNNNVLLVGYVASNKQKDMAYNIAKSLTNVHKVYDQLRVGHPSSAFDEAKDLWLSGRIKAALIKKKGIHSGQVTVVVHDSTAYLLGILPNSNQAVAADVVRQISGINKVVTLFENS